MREARAAQIPRSQNVSPDLGAGLVQDYAQNEDVAIDSVKPEVPSAPEASNSGAPSPPNSDAPISSGPLSSDAAPDHAAGSDAPSAPCAAPNPLGLDAAVNALIQAAEALSAIRASRLPRVERDLMELAKAIATRVISKELTTDPSILVALARDGLEVLSERENVTVRFAADLSPDLRTYLSSELLHRAPSCNVLFDSDLAEGSCVVESAQGYVDESVSARLDVVMEQLGFGHGGSR